MPDQRFRSFSVVLRPYTLLAALIAGAPLADASSGFSAAAGDPPAIVSVVPAAGFQGGGELVSLSLSGFVAGVAVDVEFGSALAVGTPVGAGSATSVSLLTPVNSAVGPVDVTVTQVTGSGTLSATLAGGFEVLGAEIESLSETSGPQAGGQALSAQTNGFSPGSVVVRMGGTVTTGTVLGVGAQQFVQWTTVTVPAPGLTLVRFIQGGIDVVLPDAFTFLAPAVTAVDPPSGAWYQALSLDISGENFAPNLPATVMLGAQGPIAAQVLSANAARVELPAEFLDVGGPLDLVVSQAGIDTELEQGFEALPSLDVTVTGNTTIGGSVRFAIASVQGGFGVVYAAASTSPVPLQIPGVNSGLLLDFATTVELGSGGLLNNPTVALIYLGGLLPPGLSLPVQGLAVEFGLLGAFAGFTEVETVTIP